MKNDQTQILITNANIFNGTSEQLATGLKNVRERAAEALGEIDAEKMMEIFDLPLFNEDGTFREKGGPTKPTVQDVDLTNYQIVTDLNELQVWLKIPQKGGWRHIDLKAMFAS